MAVITQPFEELRLRQWTAINRLYNEDLSTPKTSLVVTEQ